MERRFLTPRYMTDIVKQLSKKWLKRLIISALLILAVTSCAMNGSPRLIKLGVMPKEKVCRLAVLPFVNETDFELGGLIFYRIFMSELVSSGNYVVSQEGDIRKIYGQLKISHKEAPTFEQVRILADRLNVQLLITGKVVDMAETVIEQESRPSLSVDLQIIQADPARILWTTHHRSEGERYRKVMHYGMENTITGLAKRVSSEIMELWFSEGFNRCMD